MAIKLIIDTDPGVDDAMAILFAARHPKIDLIGMTTVFGNVFVEQASRNALVLAEMAGQEIPVATGAGQPLVLPPFQPSKHVHGDEGFGDLPAITPKGRPLEESAAEFLVRMAREHKGELVLCPVGPVTNIAAAIQLDPEFSSNVKQIVFMGGALDRRGNVSPFAEANIWHDPHALDIVLQSGADVVMIGLDVTTRVLLEEPDFQELASLDAAHGGFLEEISRFYLEFYRSIGLSGCAMHDAMAVVACIRPELFTYERTPMHVILEGEEIGATRRTTGRPEIAVAMDCQAEAVRAVFYDAFKA